MRTQRFVLAMIVAALIAPLPAQKLDVDLQRAIQKETVSGDLKAAIEDYRKIVARAGSDRSVAAKALVHMAECYAKLGDIESRKIYERVAKEYADQKQAATVARARLGGANSPVTAKGDRAVDRHRWLSSPAVAPCVATTPAETAMRRRWARIDIGHAQTVFLRRRYGPWPPA